MTPLIFEITAPVRRGFRRLVFAGALLLAGSAAANAAPALQASPSTAARPASYAFEQGTAAEAVPARLRTIIAKQLKVSEDKVTASATSVKDLGADELDLVELVMAYEREFKVQISDPEADQFRQVRDVVAYLRQRGVLK